MAGKTRGLLKRSDYEEERGRPVEDVFFGEDPLRSMRRFAGPIRDGAREPEALLCRHLRGRAWSLARPPIGIPSALPPYRCGKTLRPSGPDGRPALPDDCTDERACFEPADRSRDPES